MSLTEQSINVAGDIAAASITIAAIVQWLPPVAALLTIVWTVLRIYEMISGKPVSKLFEAKEE